MNNSNKENYTSIMQKEISESPDVIKNLYNRYVSDNSININIPPVIDKVIFVASGSSYNCGAIIAPFFKEYAKVPCSYEYSSEVVLQKKHFFTQNSLCIFVSQSGETSDTIKALKLIKKQNVQTLCITNAKDSAMWNLCDYRILSDAGEEKSIASTKALSAQIFCAMLILLKIAESNVEAVSAGLSSLNTLPDYLTQLIRGSDNIKAAAKILSEYSTIALLGNKSNYPLAKEGALKIKETCSFNISAYPFGEFLHGHVAVLNQKSAVVAIIDEENEESAAKILERIKTDYNPEIICISSIEGFKTFGLNLYITAKSKIKEIFGTLVTLQILSCEIARILGKNPDRPHGLNKIVKD